MKLIRVKVWLYYNLLTFLGLCHVAFDTVKENQGFEMYHLVFPVLMGGLFVCCFETGPPKKEVKVFRRKRSSRSICHFRKNSICSFLTWKRHCTEQQTRLITRHSTETFLASILQSTKVEDGRETEGGQWHTLFHFFIYGLKKKLQVQKWKNPVDKWPKIGLIFFCNGFLVF